MGPKTYYDVLRIPPYASVEEIKRAFRNLAKRYHPDKNPDPQNVIRFKHILQAYKTLSDTYKRRVYDRSINIAPYNPIQTISSDPFGARHSYAGARSYAKVRANSSSEKGYTIGVIGIYIFILLATLFFAF